MRGRVPESGPGPAVALEIRGFIADRAAQETVNMCVGLLGALFLWLPIDSFAPSPAFQGLLRTAPENLWAAILFLWGSGTALAWLCAGWVRCRAWGMLGSCGMYAFLTINTGISSDWSSLITVICASQMIGCLVTYFRLVGFANAVAR